MYVQITTRCNMKCDHCCYSCRPGAGKHMPFDTFIRAGELAIEYGEETISLGGGEPTLHPRFFDMINWSFNRGLNVWLATNGSRRKRMMRLHDIIEGEDGEIFMPNEYSLCVALSTDYFHDSRIVDDRVMDIWNRKAGNNVSYGMRDHHYECRDVTRIGPIKAGRAARTGNYVREHDCVCSDILIQPDGVIRGCGCKKAPSFGTVFQPGIPEHWMFGECSFSEEQKKEGYNE